MGKQKIKDMTMTEPKALPDKNININNINIII